MLYNIICNDIDNKTIELFNTFKNKIINEGDGTFYKNSYYLAFLNSQPIAIYINSKNIIHMILLEKSSYQKEYIINTKKGIVYFDNIKAIPKEIIELSRNKKDFFNNNIKEIEI